ncbi:MAG: hypothetical protein LBJ96_04150 [Holosporaceae bacterium]|jgi:hypothetical protein|nr:hypothetical protein [Holosporaceae bacterium]
MSRKIFLLTMMLAGASADAMQMFEPKTSDASDASEIVPVAEEVGAENKCLGVLKALKKNRSGIQSVLEPFLYEGGVPPVLNEDGMPLFFWFDDSALNRIREQRKGKGRENKVNRKVFLLTMMLAGASADATPVFESTSSDIFDPSDDLATALVTGGGGTGDRHSMVSSSPEDVRHVVLRIFIGNGERSFLFRIVGRPLEGPQTP